MSDDEYENLDVVEKQHLDYRNIFMKKDEHGQVVTSKNLQPKQKEYPELFEEDRVIQRNPTSGDKEYKEYHQEMEQYMHETTVAVRLREVSADLKKAPGFWKRIVRTIKFDTIDFSPLGVGYPQFFVFIQYCCYILVTFFFASGAYNLLQNREGGKICGKNAAIKIPCPTEISYSIVNRMFSHENYQKIVINEKVEYKEIRVYDYITYNYLHILTILGVVFVMIALRQALQRIQKKYAETHIPIAEYTLVIKHSKAPDAQFLQNFNEQREKQNIITFIKSEHNVFSIEQITLFYRYSENKKLKTYTGKAYITFKSEKDKDAIVHNISMNSKRNKQNTYIIKDEAKDPLDINWENTGIKNIERKGKNLKNYFYDMLVLLGAFLIICWFQHYTDTGSISFNSWGSVIDKAINQDEKDRLNVKGENDDDNSWFLQQQKNILNHTHTLSGSHNLKLKAEQRNKRYNSHVSMPDFSDYDFSDSELIEDGELQKNISLNYTFYRLSHCVNNHYIENDQNKQCLDTLHSEMSFVEQIYRDYGVVTLRWYLLMKRLKEKDNDVCSFKDHQNSTPFQDCLHKTLQQQVSPQYPLPFTNLNECDFEFNIENEDIDLFAVKYFIENEVLKFVYKDLSAFEKWDLLNSKLQEWYGTDQDINFWLRSSKDPKYDLGINKKVTIDSPLWKCTKEKVEEQIPLNRISYWCDLLFIFPLLIEAMNTIIGSVIEYTTEKTRNLTHTQDVAQMAKRNCLLEFINSAIGFSFLYCFYPLISYTDTSLIYWKNMYEIEYNKIVPQSLEEFVNIQRVKYQMEQPGGMISITYSWIFMSNLIITPFIYSIGPPDRLINALFRSKFKGRQQVVAKDGKEVYTAFTYVLHERYAYVINTMMCTAFFAPLLPISLVWAFISLVIMYCIEKYKLLNTASVTRPVSYETTLVMCNMLDYFLVIYCFGYMTFSYLATSNEFIRYAMGNMNTTGEYHLQDWKFLWIQSDDSSLYKRFGFLKNFGIISMLDSFIQWGAFGLIIIAGYFFVAYIMDWKSQKESALITKQFLHNELSYGDAKQLLFETDYETEQKKFEEEYFEGESNNSSNGQQNINPQESNRSSNINIKSV